MTRRVEVVPFTERRPGLYWVMEPTHEVDVLCPSKRFLRNFLSDGNLVSLCKCLKCTKGKLLLVLLELWDLGLASREAWILGCDAWGSSEQRQCSEWSWEECPWNVTFNHASGWVRTPVTILGSGWSDGQDYQVISERGTGPSHREVDNSVLPIVP